MGIIRTDKWLLNLYDKPVEICEKLQLYFDDAHPSEIYNHLVQHGMYRPPFKEGKEIVEGLKKNRVWEIVLKQKNKLQEKWKGPNIPIFIFPADKKNHLLTRDFNGKSGLAYKDKLFLFISEKNEEEEIKALFTHEYNHVCRLSKLHKKEKDITLLDTIILEGSAENAVREELGEDSLASWTTYYSDRQLIKIWNNIVLPNRNVRTMDRPHHEILYGLRSYPKMAGYCVGYYLVKRYMEGTEQTSLDLLRLKSPEIAQI